MASKLLAASFLAGLACAAVLPPSSVEVIHGARSESGLVPLSPRAIEARGDHNTTLNIGWQVQDDTLFSANWTGGTGNIPLGVVPVEGSVAGGFSLSVECNDCRTFGSILADFNDSDGLDLSLTFNGVGVYMDFGLFASQQGTFTIGLGRVFGKGPTGSNIANIFNATLGIGIDLVLQFTGDVKALAGFQVEVPDHEKIGVSINLPDLNDITAGNLNVSADLDVIPKVNFALLPIELSRTSANITAAIVLRAEAAIGLQQTPLTQNLNFDATVKADVTLAEVKFGEVSTDGSNGQCKLALFADVDVNAAAEAKVGGEIFGHEFDRGPDVSTVFLSAGTTRCLGTSTLAEPATTTSASKTSSTPAEIAACPATDLVTSVSNVTKTVSVTSCLVSAINCPPSLSQVVVVTSVAASTATHCANTNTTATSTTKSTTVSSVAFHTSGVITLPPLTTPIVTSLATGLYSNVTAPVNATVSGVAVTVPPFTTPPPQTTGAINVGGRNDTGPATVSTSTGAAAVRGAVGGGSLMGLVGVLVGAVALI